MASIVITNDGSALLADMIAGIRTATFTQMQLSSHDYSGSTLENLSSLADVEQTTSFSSVSVLDPATVKLTAVAENTSIVTAFSVKTIGLVCTDSNSDSILYAVVDISSEPDLQPAYDGVSVARLNYEFKVQVGAASAVSVDIVEATSADQISYDNTNSRLLSTNVKDAIDELAGSGGGSLIKVQTTEASLVGETVTLTIGDSTYTGVFGADKKCTISGVKEDGIATLTASDGNRTATNQISITFYGVYSVNLNFVYIYGVEWDGTNTTAFTRTDDAADFVDPVPYYSGMDGDPSSPFDLISPWKDMVVSDRTGGKEVAIPKFYYKRVISGSNLSIKIIPGEFEDYALEHGYSISPGHADRGDGNGERDVIYVGRYHCATSNYKSNTGEKPKASITRDAARQAIKALGTGISQIDYMTWQTLWLLYLVEFADWNTQEKIGYGCGNNSATEDMGYTDSMPYHTGTILSSKQSYGVSTQYRNIEGLWDNVLDWIDGVYFNGKDVYAIKNPTNFSDTTGGTKVCERPETSNYISAFQISSVSGFDYFMYPSAVAGSDHEYVCDYCHYSASGVVLCGGGGYSQSQYRGLFYLDGSDAASYSYPRIGCRLQELP